MKFIKTISLLLFFYLISAPCFSKEPIFTSRLHRSIKYETYLGDTRRGPARVHVLKINLADPDIEVIPKFALDQIGATEEVSSIARRENAIAAVNGTFFSRASSLTLPIGTIIYEGRIAYNSSHKRTAMLIKKNKDVCFDLLAPKINILNLDRGTSFNVWGINRPRKRNEIIIYTKEYGKTTRTNYFGRELIVENDRVAGFSTGNSDIPENGYVVSFTGWNTRASRWFPVGSKVKINYELPARLMGFSYAITGGPILAYNNGGIGMNNLNGEEFAGRLLLPNARTAVGVGYADNDISQKNKILFLIKVDRGQRCGGMTYEELSSFMTEIGVKDGMGLDGGSSSTMYIDGQEIASTNIQRETKVSNALVVKVKDYKCAGKDQGQNYLAEIFNVFKDVLLKKLQNRFKLVS